jgi:putative transposase
VEYAMEENKIITLSQPGEIADPLTEVLRNGARALLARAIEAEVAETLAAHAHLTTDDGRRRLVRHGHMPERTIQTGIGPVAVRQPRVRDRGGLDGERIRFFFDTFAALRPAHQEPRSLLPILYLREIWMAQGRADAEKAFGRFLCQVRGQIRQSDRLPRQGSGGAVGVLRLPCRALEAYTHR